MSTSAKSRINISVSNALEKVVSKLARRDQMPQATKAAELLRIAVEIEEDMVWNEIANGRDTKDAKFVSHKKAWA